MLACFCVLCNSLPQTPAGFNGWTDTLAMVDFHISALQAQLSQVYHALALAYATSRTLVRPCGEREGEREGGCVAAQALLLLTLSVLLFP